MERKVETKIVTALMFSHWDNLKTWIKCHDSNTPSPPPPKPRRYISLALSIEFSNQICNFLFFVVVFCRWNLSPSYPIKVHDLVGASTQFPFLIQYWKPFKIRRRRRITGSSKTYNRVNIKNNFPRTLLFCTFFLPSLHIYDVKMPNFMLYDEIFLFFLNVHMDLWNSTLGELPRFDKVTSINHDKDGKNVISLFKRDVFATVAIVGS